MPSSTGGPFPVQIPTLADTANIVEALTIYHYGSTSVPSTEAAVASGPDSIAKYIKNLEDGLTAAANGLVAINTIGSGSFTSLNLNDYKTTGNFRTPTTIANPTTNNYPTDANPGFLLVYASNDTVLQLYYSAKVGTTQSRFYFRATEVGSNSFTGVTWTQVANAIHNHDDLYYTETEIDARLSKTVVPSRAVYTSSNTQNPQIITATSTTSADIDNLSGTQGNIQSQINQRSLTTHLHDDRYYLRSDVSDPGTGKKTVRVFVQSGQPTDPQVNDLWFW